MKEALFYKKLKNNIVKCELCPNFCVLKENQLGKCLARKNVKGRLISLSYGKPVAINSDPIEKKPLYHFLPGTKSFSIATAGCTFKCLFCQNAEIAHKSPDQIPVMYVEPEKIVRLALENKCKSISYTYTEPVTAIEYIIDIAKLARKVGLKNIIVSNGYINEKPLLDLCKYIDAANIDLKGFNESFYKKNCFGSLKPVLKTLKILKDNGIWIEITNLIIPRLNDNLKEIDKMCKWIRTSLGSEIPLHFSRFFPMHRMLDKQITSIDILKKARDIAIKNKLKYVYIGNISGLDENTYCAKCKSLVIERCGFSITKINIKGGKCIKCNAKVPGVFN